MEAHNQEEKISLKLPLEQQPRRRDRTGSGIKHSGRIGGQCFSLVPGRIPMTNFCLSEFCFKFHRQTQSLFELEV